ncbi:MAG: hypothetical protein WA210_04480 [Burkholderiaceae bacterium]
MTITIFTLVARNYLSLALTLGDSVRHHHPEVDFRIFLADGIDGLPRNDYAHAVIALDAYLDESLEELCFKYNITEFCTSVKPILFQRLFAESSADVVFYLDPDTVLFDRLDPVLAANPTASIFFAPHLLHCRLVDDHAYPEYKHLWEGIFNLGFCALRRSTDTDRFLAWWDRRLRKYCFADHFDGLHTDQKWADYVPVYFRGALEIVAHEGVNVAHWNLDERRLENRDGRYLVNDQTLLLFHFSGFDFKGELLTRHTREDEQRRYMSSPIKSLAAWYRGAVHANGYGDHIELPYRHNYYDNGAPVTAIHRRLYRATGGPATYDRPFASKGRFYIALQRAGLMDRSSAATANYAASTVPSLARWTALAHLLLRAFLRVAGARRYALLLKLFGRYARLENQAFLLETHPAAHITATRNERSA